MKDIIDIRKDPDFDWFEIDIRVPGFDNFGKRLGEIEKEAFAAVLAADQTPEGQAGTRENLKAMAARITGAAEAEKLIEQSEEGEAVTDALSESMGEIAKMLEEIPQILEQEQSGLFSPEDIDTDDGSFDRDHESLQVTLEEGADWNAEAEARVDRFLAAWPEIRPAMLREAFACYRKCYPDLEDLAKAPGGSLELPAPTAPELIENLFMVNNLFLFEDGRLGLSGDCTWDEEHGFGAVIAGKEVAEFGNADIGFD